MNLAHRWDQSRRRSRNRSESETEDTEVGQTKPIKRKERKPKKKADFKENLKAKIEKIEFLREQLAKNQPQKEVEKPGKGR